LYNAGLSEVPSERLNWIIGRFRFISGVLGRRQRTPLVSHLRTKVDVGWWDVGVGGSGGVLERWVVEMERERMRDAW
jgi:hypothetical protein